jgi:hypothetical protein
VHGFDGYTLKPPFHLVVLRGRFVNRIGHVIHTTTSLELVDRTSIEGLAVTSATRTLIDLAAFETRERLTAAIDSAFRDGRSSEDFLHRRLVALRSRGRRGIGELLQVLAGSEVTKGGHSWLEREFLRLCAERGLPLPDMQQVMGVRRNRLIRVDCHFPGTNLIVELLGYTFHRTVMQMQDDAERMNRLMLDGHRVLQFTYVDVVERADAIPAVILEALG